MNAPTPASPKNSFDAIRTIRQKIEENRNLNKRVLAPITLSPLERSTFGQEEQEEKIICDLAVQRVKEGASIVIDWTTRSNFRVRPEFPKIKTQPIELAMARNKASHSIQSKRIELAKLLHERNKKFYLKSKQEQAEEAQLFGTDHKQSLRSSYLRKAQRKLRRSRQRRASDTKHTIQSAQQQILERCKLTQLKGQLKQKFQEIRELYNRKFQRRERRATLHT